MYTDAQKCSHIFDLQTFLRRIQQAEGSAAPLVPDGIWDAKTAAAVREYQQQNCLPVTGIADQRTWNAIYATYAALVAADALPMQTAFIPQKSPLAQAHCRLKPPQSPVMSKTSPQA